MRLILVPVFSFFLLAFLFSWLVDTYLAPVVVHRIDLKTIGTGLGPALSGLVCYTLFQTPNTYRISLSGTKPLLSYGIALLALVTPLLLVQKTSKTLLAASIFTQFIYTLGEELGWRHYLQNATSSLTKWIQALLIGLVWFLWHYSILADPTIMLTGQAMPLYIGIPLLILLLTLLSHLLGSLVMRTQTILLPTIIHYIGKVGNGPTILIVFGFVLTAYFVWNKLLNKSRIDVG